MSRFLEKKLDKEQLEAVAYGEGPLLIVAGAGTGKTTVITERFAYLVNEKKVSPEQILAITFTDKAAEEMEERIDGLLSLGYLDLWVSTFHSFCERLLKDCAIEIGLSPDFAVVDETKAWLLIYQNFDRFNLKYYRPLGNSTKFIHALISHFSRCKDEMIYPEDYLKYSDSLRLNLDNIPIGSKEIKGEDKTVLALKQEEADRVKEIAEAYHTYQQILLSQNSLDFGDLIGYALKALEQKPLVLEKARKQFKYLLVDEFQDTNFAQYKLLKTLTFPENNLTVCGDDDQAIYRFRGASFNNVLQFREDYPQSKEVVLINNYRSCQNILDKAYNFIQLNNPNRLEYQINQVEELSKKAKRKGVSLEKFKKISKKLKANKKEIGLVEYLHFNKAEQEIKGVLKKIIELLQKDKEASFRDFAILIRANRMADPFCKSFDREGLPYQFLAARGLYSKPVILDIISYFKLLDDYHETSAFYRVLNFPFLEIPYEDIVKITRFSAKKSQPLFQTTKELPLVIVSKKTEMAIAKILALLEKHSLLSRHRNASEVFVSFLNDSGYLKELTKGKRKEKNENLDFINQFYEKIKQFENENIEPSLVNFMKQIGMELEAGDEGEISFDVEQGPDSVKIMTLHGAKGLEFKYVFLTNLTQRNFPSSRRKEAIEIPDALVKEVIPSGDAHLQEERRLFYVGMTRAKKGIFFTSAKDYGGKRAKKMSPFLKELGYDEKNDEKNQRFQPEERNFGVFKRTPENFLSSHFSFTQLAAFGKCPLQYKFAHILKIPSKGKGSFTYGKTMHNTLEKWVSLYVYSKKRSQSALFPQENSKDEDNGSISLQAGLEELMALYNKEWANDWFESEKIKDEYYKLGKKSLTFFFDDFIKNLPKIKNIEGKPALEKNFNLKIGSYDFIGKIDRIDEAEEGQCELIDYKTGEAKNILENEDKEQLLTYQIAAEEVLKIKPIRLTYYYLNESKKTSFLGSSSEKETLKNKIIKQIEEIKRSKFEPTPGWQCRHCDFKEICEYREL